MVCERTAKVRVYRGSNGFYQTLPIDQDQVSPAFSATSVRIHEIGSLFFESVMSTRIIRDPGPDVSIVSFVQKIYGHGCQNPR